MAKITSQNFTTEQFQSESSWIGKLFSPLNSFISQVVTAFSNRISVRDNLYQEIKSYEFVNETSNYPLRFTPKFNKYPEGVVVLGCVASDRTMPSEYPLLDWSFKDNFIELNSISGLTTSKKYTIKLLIIYE